MKRVFLSLLVVSVIGLGIFMSGCGTMMGNNNGANANADTTPPTVSSTTPANAAIGVAINRKIAATFSEAMDPATITAATFTLKQGATTVPCAVTYVGFVATLTPTTNLAINTTYTAKITTGAKDLVGNALAVDKTWSFTTGAVADTTAPTVTGTINANGATGVALNTKVGATFSEAMDPATITAATFTFKQGTTAVDGTVSYTGVNAVFKPTSNLAANTIYTATITTGAEDLAGNPLAANYVWSWTTGTTADTIAPTVTLTIPTDLAIGVAINADILATFSEAMDPLTINTATFTLTDGITTVPCDVTYTGNIATLNPTSNLAADTIYVATITTGVQDITGNAMAVEKIWSFKTGTTVPAAGPAPVELGTASNFVILSKSGISTTGTTKIYGNIGVSPIDRTALTGFSETMDPSNVFSTSIYVSAPGTFVANSGKLYAADYTAPTPSNMTTAISNMETAYTDAAGRATPTATELGAGDIGGMTLAPGLYKWSTGLNIPTDVTLSGGANDVWIFEIAQDLTLANGIKVNLSGGAQAKNIFWQIAGQTTLGTGSTMNGNMICQTLIALNTGAILNGRLLAQTAVTLDTATVTLP